MPVHGTGAREGRRFPENAKRPCRASAREGEGCLGPRSSGVEHFLGKEEVIGSKPIAGSKHYGATRWCRTEGSIESTTALLGLAS